MNAPFLCGIFAAWSLALVGVGLFLCLAYVVLRREAEYLLFGIVALTFAVTTAGISLSYYATTLPVWHLASKIAHVGSTVAVPVHLHFALRFSRARRTKPLIVPAYLISLAYGAVHAAGWWWVPGSEAIQVSIEFGYRVAHMTAIPLPHAISYYAFAVVVTVATIAVFLRAYRAGQREALLPLLGAGVLLIAALNDALLSSAVDINSVYVLPHAFLVYAFTVASTLLHRYRSAAGELEQTASSLRERTAELRHSHDELSVMETELAKQQQLASVGELAASIAHEVRNPLAVIVNATASLRHAGLRDQDRETLLGIVDEEAARLNGLVTDLLRFARPFTANRSNVNLAELATRASAVAGDGYEVEVAVPNEPELAAVSADPTLLRTALENLIENACQAMPGGGTIEISSRKSSLDGEACVRIEVSDRGCGMKPDEQSRALDPFFTTRPSGTGLGLPIVARIMEAHGGEVEIDSQPGSGTTIGLLLPVPTPGASPPAPKSRAHRRREEQPDRIRPRDTGDPADGAQSPP